MHHHACTMDSLPQGYRGAIEKTGDGWEEIGTKVDAKTASGAAPAGADGVSLATQGRQIGVDGTRGDIQRAG